MSQRRYRLLFLVLSGALLVAVAGCTATSGEPLDTSDMAGQPATVKCNAGETKVCGCAGSTTSGMKTCGDTGTFGACSCATGTGDPGSGTGSSTGTPSTPTSACGTCNGCCDGKTCIAFASQKATQCGIKGKTCAACGAGLSCDSTNGKCVTVMPSGTCAASCDGCCSPTDGCVGYQRTDSFACGVNGSACKVCPVVGGLCDDAGMCTDQVAYYDGYQISIRKIDMSGAACNTAAGFEFADPMVCLVAWDPMTGATLKDPDGNSVVGCSKYCTDSNLCELSVNQGIVTRKLADGTYVPVEFPGDVITSGQIYVFAYDWDGDGASHDLLGQGLLPHVTTLAPGTVLSAGPYSASTNFGCTVPVEFEISYDFAP